MAEDTNNPLKQELLGLGRTIDTITNKVEAGKTRVREYKSQIVTKLREVVEQLNSLKVNNNLKILPQLRKQLQDNQIELQQKTDELDKTKGELNESNQSLQQLQQNINQINKEIDEKNQQITDLNNSGNQKDSAIQELDAQVRELDKQKGEAETKMLFAQQQIDSIVQKISELNSSLVNQIQLIDTISNELGDLDNGDIADQFKNVTDNIKSIVSMLNSNGQDITVDQQPIYDVEQNFNNLVKLHLNKDNGEFQRFIRSLDGQLQQQINDVINSVDRNDPQSISTLKQILEKNEINVKRGMSGGKHRNKKYQKRKTMKKRRNKTYKKMRGGYVYSTNKELDRSSSVISKPSSLSKTPLSKTKSNKKHKTRYRTNK